LSRINKRLDSSANRRLLTPIKARNRRPASFSDVAPLTSGGREVNKPMPPAGPRKTRSGRILAVTRAWAPGVVGLILLSWAGVVLWRELRAIDPDDVAAHMRAWGAWRLTLAIGLAAASFALVALVEWLGLRWSGSPLPWRTAALRSFMVNGLIHSLGANVVVATLARSWIYRRTGLRLLASATTTAFAAMTLVCGLAVLVGVGLLSASPQQLQAIRIAAGEARIGGGLLLAAVSGYVAICAAWPSARLFGEVRLPSVSYAAAQVVIGVVDNGVSACLLWLLIGPEAPPYATFIIAYVLAYLAGLLSNVPGGAGVFEATLLLLLPTISRSPLAAGFMGFRLIFYLLPLIAALLLVGLELLRPRQTPADGAVRPR
jgi:uncharacterized membrane protein YbhN (UPF0104 family)